MPKKLIKKYQYGTTTGLEQAQKFAQQIPDDWLKTLLKTDYNGSLPSWGATPNQTTVKTSTAITPSSTSGFTSPKGGNGTFQKMGGWKGVGQVADIGSALLPDANNNPLSNNLNKGYDDMANAAAAIPGYGTLISGIMKAGAFANKGLAKITGGATTINNAGTKLDSVLSSNFFALTPIGMANSLSKSKVTGSDVDLGKSINTGYSPTMALGKKEFGGITNGLSKLFGKGDRAQEYKNQVKKVDTENLKKSNSIFANTQNQIAGMNSAEDSSIRNNQQLKGGLNTNIFSAKSGAKINPKVLSNIKNKANNKIKKTQEGIDANGLRELKDGGTLLQLNVIPEGALHARLNKYEGDLAEKVTSKGIPVITYEEDGDITQHAEIEHSEIIFTKEVTDKIETWAKEYKDLEDSTKKKELEIECGKYMSHQILENTEDNVGLLNK